MDEVKTTDELYNELVLKEEKRRSNKSEGNLGLGTAMVLQNKAGKMDFSEYSPYQNSDFYKTLTDGSRVAKFENYIPGTDNNERFARTQSSSDQIFNGLTKAVVNFGTTVVGNTVGLVGGLANGVAEGSFNAVFDNKFTNYLADLNEKLDYQLPNYVSKDEQDDNFFESMGNANFWAKDVAGAFSFTLGTAVSEAIWAVTTGGAANASKWALKAAQAGKFAKNLVNVEKTMVGLNQAKKMIAGATSKMFTGSIDNVMDAANTASKWGKIANTSRFLVTTSANEAGIEALHYKREARENFNENFERQNGRPPTSDDINEFEENLGHSANAVFATNMVILAPSSLVMFGSAFNIASPFKGMAKGFNKSVFGVGTELVEEGGEKIFKGIVASGKQKAARIAFAVTKPIATEGLFEEGLQGVTTKTAKSWIESTYDPKYNNQTMSLADATYNAFGEQYGTKEGWKEIGIGGIVGGISSVASGRGKFQEIRDFNREQEYQDKYVASGYNRFGDNSTASSITMAKKFMTDARVKEATERKIKAGKDGDDIGFALANQDILVSEIQFRASIGEDTKDLIGKYETALNAMSKEDYAEQGITDVESYKKTVLEGYTSLINSHEKASKFADSIYGDTSIMGIDSKTMETRQLKEALTRSIVSGQTANKAMDSILGEMGVIIGNDTVKATDIQRDLSRMGRNTQSRVNTLNKSILQAEIEQKLLTGELQKLQVAKDETKGQRLQTVQAKLDENFTKLTDLKNQREELAKEVSQESKRRRGVDISISKDEKGKDISLLSEYITGEDLANLDKNLQKIEDSIKGYQGINHEVYYDLLELKKQYGLAEQRFLGYQDAISGLVNKEFKPNFAKVSPFWSKVFLQKQTINDFSKAYIENAYNTYRDSIGQTAVNDLTEDLNISDNDYRAFQEMGEVSDEIKAQIAERVKNKEDLTQREKEIYDIFTTDINNLTKTIVNPNKPDLSPVENTEVLTEVQTIRQEIEQASKKDYPLIPIDVDALIEEQPSEKEIERYGELYVKKDKLDLFESEEFQELQPRMQRWFMSESLPSIGGMSLAQAIEFMQQMETQVEKEQTITEVTAEDILNSAEIKDAQAVNNEKILQNRAGSAVAKIQKNKSGVTEIFMSQVSVREIVGKLLSTGTSFREIRTVNKEGKLEEVKDLTDDLLDKNYDVAGTQFTVGEIKFEIGQRGNVVFDMQNYNKAKDIMNKYYFESDTGSWSWGDLYEMRGDGLKYKIISEFTKKEEGGINTISDAIYDVAVGEDLDIFVDLTTKYNKKLIDDAIIDVAKDNVVSDKTKKDIFKNLELTTKKDRVNNSTLKASGENTTDDNFMLIRKRFAEKFIYIMETEDMETPPKKIEMQVEVPVSDIFLGTPNFVLDQNNQPIEFNFDQRSLERPNFITQGYAIGGEMFFADKKIKTENVSRLYISNLEKQNPGFKIPIVVLQKGVYKFAFPISLIKTEENQADKLDALQQNAKDFNSFRAEVNNLLISLGSNTKFVEDSDLRLQEIREELEKYETHITAEELASVEYDKINLINDAKIKIDPNDVFISSPKLTVDFSKATIGDEASVTSEATELRKDIIQDVIVLRDIINSSPDLPDNGRFIQAFAENDVENQGSDIMNRKDIKFIKAMFFNADKKIAINSKDLTVKALGKENLLNLRKKLENLKLLEDQVQIRKDKETAKKLNCN